MAAVLVLASAGSCGSGTEPSRDDAVAADSADVGSSATVATQRSEPLAEPAPVRISGVAASAVRQVEQVVARLPADAGLLAVAFGAPPTPAPNEDGTAPKVPAGALWARVTFAPAADDVARTRRFWLNALLVPALWRDLRAAGVAVAGGEVVAPDVADPLAPEAARFAIPAGESQLYRDASGDPTTSLTVDEAALRGRIAAAAPRMGLRIDDVRLWGIDGTIVEIRATASDPEAFLREHANDYPYGDDGRLEGRLLVVVDPSGTPFWASGYGRGLGVGTTWASPAYAATLSGGATVGPEPGSAASIPYTGA